MTIQNDQISYVKHVLAPLYVFSHYLGGGGGWLPRGLGLNLLMQFSRPSSPRMVVPLPSSRCLAEGNRIYRWSREGKIGQGGRGRTQGGERPMGTTAEGRERVQGKGSEWRSANRRRPLQTRTIHQRRHAKPPHPLHPQGVLRIMGGGAPTNPFAPS